MTCEELETSLRKLPWRDLEVRVGGRSRRLVAVIATPDFERMNDGERQHEVWGHLIDTHGLPVEYEVEFVFTYTPRQLAELDRRERELHGTAPG